MKNIFFVLAVCLILLVTNVWALTPVLDTGDPNERVCNPKSYTDLGNGIVRDNVTGLEWQQATAPGIYTWQEALDYCSTLDLGGNRDWRFPTVEELATLVDVGQGFRTINTTYFPDTLDWSYCEFESCVDYWSSTFLADDPDFAWYVEFRNGDILEFPWLFGEFGFVRAVRGGPYVQSGNFVPNGDGTVTDTTTGLMWQQCSYGQTWTEAACSGTAATRTLQQAVDYVQGLNNSKYLGYGDWRLPTINELFSLMDYSRVLPATTFPSEFPSSTAYYMSSTTDTTYHYTRAVDFTWGGGGTTWSAGYVRAVRGGPCLVDEGDCSADNDCEEGSKCVEGACVLVVADNPPAIELGPFVAAGPWPLLSTSQASPMYLKRNVGVLWTFSDDFASCSGDCTHTAEYSVVGTSDWIPITVSSDAAEGMAWASLPIEDLQNAATYAFRFTVTDCAGQSTQSGEYYFKVARTDAPPVILSGPYLAAGPWPKFAATASSAFVLRQNSDVLWTFSDDYVFCTGLCTHRARFRKVGDTAWTWITASTDPDGIWYAYATLPVDSLDAGTYQFYFDVLDCASQRTYAPKVYYFKVE